MVNSPIKFHWVPLNYNMYIAYEPIWGMIIRYCHKLCYRLNTCHQDSGQKIYLIRISDLSPISGSYPIVPIVPIVSVISFWLPKKVLFHNWDFFGTKNPKLRPLAQPGTPGTRSTSATSQVTSKKKCHLLRLSMDWFKRNFIGKSHISWENRWFSVDFPMSQSIDIGIPM